MRLGNYVSYAADARQVKIFSRSPVFFVHERLKTMTAGEFYSKFWGDIIIILP